MALPVRGGSPTAYDAGFNGGFSDLQITGNILRFEPESASRTISGSANYGIGLQALGNVSNAFVFGNEIVRAPVRASPSAWSTACIQPRAWPSCRIGSWMPDRMRSSGALYYSAAISLQGHLSSIDVLRNRLEFLSNPFVGRYSYWSFETGYAFTNVVVAGNYATAVEGFPTNGLTLSVIQTLSAPGCRHPQ